MEVACLLDGFVVIIPEGDDLKKDILSVLIIFDLGSPVVFEYLQLRIV